MRLTSDLAGVTGGPRCSVSLMHMKIGSAVIYTEREITRTKPEASEGVRNHLRSITDSFKEALGDNLVGVYLHGSLAMGCFNPTKSDVDLIIIVGEPLTLAEKQQIIASLVALSEHAPPKGIEMSVVLRKFAKDFVYPTRFELHFGKEHIPAFHAGEFDYGSEKCDPDLAGHFTVIKERGICLDGVPIDRCFGEIPRDAYLKSIMNDVQDAEKEILDDPVYVILNLCRVLAFLRDGKVTSKVEGGSWALKNGIIRLPDLIERALTDYASISLEENQWNPRELLKFARHALGLIREQG